MAEVLEASIEDRLTRLLTGHGFKVLKLVTPGTNGTMDRLILRPKWSPGPPWFIELKRPKKHERRLQELVRDEWRERGALVLDMVNTYEQVDALVFSLRRCCCIDVPAAWSLDREFPQYDKSSIRNLAYCYAS